MHGNISGCGIFFKEKIGGVLMSIPGPPLLIWRKVRRGGSVNGNRLVSFQPFSVHWYLLSINSRLGMGYHYVSKVFRKFDMEGRLALSFLLGNYKSFPSYPMCHIVVDEIFIIIIIIFLTCFCHWESNNVVSLNKGFRQGSLDGEINP